ncbi:GvpL/GvpF family gas vesicle protein [Jiangella asiatica]|uniref:GvpL/GvpF family gas vesicle protein n=1 Tax=Jiangella asiatica TaxID=2530372 RepID=A0A4R5CK96_9ACTN|nr:GvpL/GvpF family gas vesicle protein [Jiangella asiatica]TDD99040.1 GvpL/GvpF family gas vesicle protein [Jiangella asiatica]
MTLTRPDAAMDDEPAAAMGGHAHYIYAIVPAGTTAPGELTGIDDARIEVIEHGSIAAVVGVLRTGRVFGRRDDLLAHSRVNDAMALRGPVVPVRFGSLLADADEVVTELLLPNGQIFADLLADLTGRRQFLIRARYDEEVVLAEIIVEHADIRMLRDRTRDQSVEMSLAERVKLGELVARALEVKRDVDGAGLLDLLTPHAVDWSFRESGEVDYLLEAAFLVEDKHRSSFDDAAEQAATALAGRARVQLLGPSAPYDFVPGDERWVS